LATFVITGCNRGIGLELCRQANARGDEVIAVCRSASAALRKLDVEIVEGVDVSDAAGAEKLAAALKNRRVDVLINNAGILRSDRLETVDFDKMLEQYRVNTIGPLRITRALAGMLGKGSKVGIVTSRVGSIDDNGSGNNYGYRCSKAAANMVGVNLHHDLSGHGVSVMLLHPGLVATDMTGGSGVSAEKAAAGLLERLDELTPKTSGTFWHAEGYQLPW
jgi:NAD(P)-dependent dehydrogenase (short-subunit alcohol dehydrogenase family)